MCGISDYAEQPNFIAKLSTVHRILKLSLNEMKKSQLSWSLFELKKFWAHLRLRDTGLLFLLFLERGISCAER